MAIISGSIIVISLFAATVYNEITVEKEKKEREADGWVRC